MTTLHGGYDYSVISVHFFICKYARSDLMSMQQNYKLLFENKIGCVANLLEFNDGQREILKTAAWISLNDLMLNQQKEYSDDEHHLAQWLLVIKIGKNVETFLNANKSYASNDIWHEFSNTQPNNGQLLQLIDYMVERCR